MERHISPCHSEILSTVSISVLTKKLKKTSGSKLICETTQGYKMENLVSSYIKQLEKTIKKTNAKTKSNL